MCCATVSVSAQSVHLYSSNIYICWCVSIPVKHASIRNFRHPHIHACMHACMQAFMHTYTPTYTHEHIHPYIPCMYAPMQSGSWLHDRLAGSDLGDVGRPNSPPASRKDSMRRKPPTRGDGQRRKVKVQ